MTEHKRLTDEEIAEIRKRAQRALDLNPFDSLKYLEVSGTVYNEDIPKLLAEIGALQEDNAQLRTKVRKARRLDEDFEDTYDFIYGGDNE